MTSIKQNCLFGVTVRRLCWHLVCLSLVMVFLAVGPALADPCPAAMADPNGNITGLGPPGNQQYELNLATQGNCNLIITFNGNGSINTTGANSAPYDGIEDQLIGVVNNTSNPITTIALSNPGVPIFGFDQDGICVYQPFAANASAGACNGGSSAATDPGDYLGTASSFSNISGGLDSGSVNWASGIAPGSTGYFSLEEQASLNLQVNPTPEPGTLILWLTGIGLGFLMRKRLAQGHQQAT